MHERTFLLSALLGLAALAAGASGQEPNRPQDDPVRRDEPRASQHIENARPNIGLERLLDAEARLEAQDPETEPEDAPTCEIQDYVVSLPDGRIHSAVLSVGGVLGIGERHVLLPLSPRMLVLKEDGAPCIDSALTKEELKTMPEFDLGEAKKDARRLEGAAPLEAGVRRGIQDSPDPVPAGTDGGTPTRYWLASQVIGCEFHGSDDKFGVVDNVSVDPGTMEVGYLLVSQGGVLGIGEDIYVVPCSAVSFGLSEDQAPIARVARTKKQLEGGVRWQKPEDKDQGLILPSDAQRADEIFGTHRDRPGDPAETGERRKY